jgi:hypothetical protein
MNKSTNELDLQAEREGLALKRLNQLVIRTPNSKHIHTRIVHCTHKKKLTKMR